MPRVTRHTSSFFSSKPTRQELAKALAAEGREDLINIIFSLSRLEQLMTAAQIARATKCKKSVVIADMKSGKFVDPIFGGGFYCAASNSLKVSVSAANRWRGRMFVPIERADPIPTEKNSASQNDVDGENAGQKRAAVARAARAVALAGRNDRRLDQ